MASGPMSIGSPSEHLAPPPLPAEGVEPKHGGSTRFEIELEFVQSLGNPHYLNHLASGKYFEKPAFVNYLAYLMYWTRPPYLKYLTYPGPAIKHLELLQEEKFRKEIISPELVNRLVEEGVRAGIEHHQAKAEDNDMDKDKVMDMESKVDEPTNGMGGQLDGAFDDEINNTDEIATSVTLTNEEDGSQNDSDDDSICSECLVNEFNPVVGQVCSACLNRKLEALEVRDSSDEEEVLGQLPLRARRKRYVRLSNRRLLQIARGSVMASEDPQFSSATLQAW